MTVDQQDWGTFPGERGATQADCCVPGRTVEELTAEVRRLRAWLGWIHDRWPGGLASISAGRALAGEVREGEEAGEP